LGSKAKTLGAALEPCSGLSLDVGRILGQQVPQEQAGLVFGTEMVSGCALLALMGSTPPVTGSTSPVSEADAVPIYDSGLPVVSIAEVNATMMNVSATPVTIPMIPERAESWVADGYRHRAAGGFCSFR
jgi:hypothetical protein